MQYVVVIEKQDGTKNYKAFTQSGDAVKRHEKATYHMHSNQLVRFEDGDEAFVVSSRLFRAKTDDAREAVHLVQSGNAETFEPQAFYRVPPPSLDDL